MNGLLAVVNPSRRRRKAGKRRGHGRSAAQRAATRKMLAANRSRRGGSRKRRSYRRNMAPAMASAFVNPRKRRGSRGSRKRSMRRYRRNPIGGATMRASLGAVQRVLTNAAIGSGGAIATDVVMAQAAAFLPVSMTSRYDAAGGINFGYYGIKAGLAIALGVLGSKFLPGKLKGVAARGAEGALTVQAYELTRAMLPASIVLGYMTPGRVAGAYVEGPKRSGMGAYVPALGAYVGPDRGLGNYAETRVGEGAVN